MTTTFPANICISKIFNKLFLFLILTTLVDHVLSQSCENVVPFHALKLNNNSCAWECKPGYYITTPSTLLGLPTCRPCSIERFCGIGMFQTQCTNLNDRVCSPCPSLFDQKRGGEVYSMPNDCVTTLCGDGWWLNTNNSFSNPRCELCPPGSFCNGGLLQSCGANCSTGAVGGISSLLECKQTVGQELAFSVRFTLSGIGISFNDNQCRALNLDMIAWLQYGTFQGCIIDILSPSLGMATCTITAAHCIAGEYLRWLLQQLFTRQLQTTALLATCLQYPNLFVGAPLVQQSTALILSSYTINKASRPTDAPPLILEAETWGVSHTEALAALGLAILLSSGLIIALLLLCAMWRTSALRQNIVDNIYEKIQNRHNSKAIKGKIQSLKPLPELKKDIP